MLSKSLLKEHLNHWIEERIFQSRLALNSTIESRDKEEKSSAGDKYETGRSMMQIEQERNEIQLNKYLLLQTQFRQIDFEKSHSKVANGSLLYTNKGYFFLGLAFGKFSLEDEEVYGISVASPIGKIFANQEEGHEFTFRSQTYKIRKIF